MSTADREQAARQINAMAKRSHWPLLADARLSFATPQLQSVFATWTAKCGDRVMPARADMTLRDLKTALPNIAFLDVVREGDRVRFKVRLAGGAYDTFLGATPTGRFIDETVPHAFAKKWADLWLPSVSYRAPSRVIARVEFPNRHYYVSETLHAPLATNGITPDIMMVVTYFHGRDDLNSRNDLATRLMDELGEIAAPVAVV